MSHKKFGPDRFSRFDVYRIQTNKRTNKQTNKQTDKPNLYIDSDVFFSLMEGEIRRLKIELDVYSKTVLELRKKLDLKTNMAETKSSNLSTADEKTIKTLEEKLSSALDENKELSVKVEKLTEKIYELETIEKDGRVNVSLDQEKLDEAVNVRLEKIQQELREQLNSQHRVKSIFEYKKPTFFNFFGGV